MPSLRRMRAGWGAGEEEGAAQAGHTPFPQASDFSVQVCLDDGNGWIFLRPLVRAGRLPVAKVTAVEEGKGRRTRVASWLAIVATSQLREKAFAPKSI